MKKIALFVSALIFTLILISCGKTELFIPSYGNGLILEVRQEGSSSDVASLILHVDKTDNGYSARITEPSELSDVSVVSERGTIILNTDRIALPLSNKSGAGLSVLFGIIDVVCREGIPVTGSSFDIDGFHTTIETSPSLKRVCFTVSDGSFERSFVLREAEVNEQERYPETSG